jgi:hypothetical protein
LCLRFDRTPTTFPPATKKDFPTEEDYGEVKEFFADGQIDSHATNAGRERERERKGRPFHL